MIYTALTGLYIAIVILSPVFSAKIIALGPWTFLAWTPMGVFTIAIVDSITQNWSKKHSKNLIWIAFFIRMFIYLGIFPILFFLPNAGAYDIQPLFQQIFRNFVVSEVTTLVGRNWIEIPIFSSLTKWPFIAKHIFANTFFMIFKGSTKVFFQYVGVAGVALVPLMVGDVAAKMIVVFIGAPFSTLVNWTIGKIKKLKPKWAAYA